MNVRDMEVLAPTGSIELQQYQRTKHMILVPEWKAQEHMRW